MPIRVKSIIHQCFRHSFDQRSINTHSSCSLQRSLLSHVLQRVAFFCALLTCAYYKIYCSNSFKKKKKAHKHSRAQRMGKARVLHLLFSKTKQFFTVWATFFFFATGAAQDSQFCSRTSEWDDTRCHRGSNHFAPLSLKNSLSPLTQPPSCSKYTFKGKATRWKVINKTEVQHLLPGCFQDKFRLTFPPPLFPPIRSQRWDADGIANALWMLLLNFTLRLCLLKSH